MKSSKHLLSLIVLLFSISLHAQVPIEGDLQLGDTTQVHQIETVKGDRFTGLVTGFDQNKLTFEYAGNALTFNFDQIKKIKVLSSDQATSSAPENVVVKPLSDEQVRDNVWPFDYQVTLSDSSTYMGLLTKVSEWSVNLGKGPVKTLEFNRINSIKLMGKRLQDVPDIADYHRLRTENGDRFTGQLISYDGASFVFALKSGDELTFSKEEVDYIRLEEPNNLSEGRSKKPNPFPNIDYFNQQRIFFSPSAFLLEEGVTEFRTVILQNQIDHGFSKNLTMGVGLFTVLVASAATGKFKVGGSIGDKLHLAAGAQGFVAFTIFDSEAYALGLAYGAITIGSKERFITASIGTGKASGDNNRTNAFTLGGSYRTGKNWRIYMEYLHFQSLTNSSYTRDPDQMGSLGMSWIKNQHQVDFGFYGGNLTDAETNAIPVVAYSLRF